MATERIVVEGTSSVPDLPTKLRGLPSWLVREFLAHDRLPIDPDKQRRVLQERAGIVAGVEQQERDRERKKGEAFTVFYNGLSAVDRLDMDRKIAGSGDQVGALIREEGDASYLLGEEWFVIRELRDQYKHHGGQRGATTFQSNLSEIDQKILTNLQYGLALREYRAGQEKKSPDLKETKVSDSGSEADAYNRSRALLEKFVTGAVRLDGIMLTEGETSWLEGIKGELGRAVKSNQAFQSFLGAQGSQMRKLVLDLSILTQDGSRASLARMAQERAQFRDAQARPGAPVEQPKGAKQEGRAQEWRDVHRTSEVMAVGDLFGSVEALRVNLESLGVVSADANGGMRWIGQDKKIVFHGDILGDRQAHGLDVLEVIAKLSQEAVMQGGEIEILAGNHEDFFLSFLSGRTGAGYADAFESCRQGRYYGLLELCKFGSSSLRRVDLEKFGQLPTDQQQAIWSQLNTERALILNNMRQDSQGKALLKAMCTFKLAKVYDDSLFTHTDPTLSMMKVLTQQEGVRAMVDRVNAYYQEGLRKTLIDGKEPNPFFDQLRDVFLDTNNREYFWRELIGKDEVDFIEKVKQQGINAIFHGHTDQFLPVYERNGLRIASVDMGAMRDANHQDNRSVLKIKQNGAVERGKDFTSIRQ